MKSTINKAFKLFTKFGNEANKNQLAIKKDNGVFLYSYNTFIAMKSENIITVSAYWDYSNTTMFYFKQFLEHYLNINLSKKEIETALRDKKEINGYIIKYCD